MTILADISTVDTDQIFLDWGQPATFEEVIRVFDPDSGELQETMTSSPVTVIVAPVHVDRLQQTVAAHEDRSQLVIIRSVEIPTSADLTTAKIQIGNQHLHVDSWESSQVPGLTALSCHSISA